MVCSIAGVLEAIGDRWAVLILRDLSLGLSRYEELRRSTGVTNATLSDGLKHLEENLLVERRTVSGQSRALRIHPHPKRLGHYSGDAGARSGGEINGPFPRRLFWRLRRASTVSPKGSARFSTCRPTPCVDAQRTWRPALWHDK
jgi:hypothetical protein